MTKRIFALLKKDILLELRQKHSLYGIFLYVAATIYVLFLTIEKPVATTWNSLFWIIQLFICINAVAKSFLQENKGRMLYFYSISSPAEFIIAKLIYNIFLMLIMSSISLLLFLIFLDNPLINTIKFLGITFLGSISISLVFTLMSAIAAKAQQNAALIAILGFPVLLPQLLLLIKLSKTAFGEIFNQNALWKLTGLITSFDILIIGMAMILFPYLWKE